MPYYPTIPQPGDQKNVSQGQILANFTELNSFLALNHEIIANTPATTGKHTKVDLLNSATHPAVAATDVLQYNFLNATTGLQELYVKRTGILGVAGVPMTASLKNANGWTYLPSGIIMKWGQVGVTGNFTQAFPTAFPTGCLSLQATIVSAFAGDSNGWLQIKTYTAAQFTGWAGVRSTGAANTMTINYFAIGY